MVEALGQLSERRYTHEMARALSHAADPDVAHDLAKALLDRLFDAYVDDRVGRMFGTGSDKRARISYRISSTTSVRTLHSLSDVQRAAIAAIAHCDTFWQIDTNLLACYNLPVERADLQAWRRQVFR